MKKATLFILLISVLRIGYSQNLYMATGGEISFFSKTPMEDIDAVNKKIKGIINIKTNEFAFISTIIGFKFQKPLMEEHFNENYMESDKYKVASFKGKIINDVDFTKDGKYPVKVKGVLNIHGVEKEREIEGTLVINAGKINVASTFDVKLKDHKVKIPKLVVKNISEMVKVTVNIDFEPKK